MTAHPLQPILAELRTVEAQLHGLRAEIASFKNAPHTTLQIREVWNAPFKHLENARRLAFTTEYYRTTPWWRAYLRMVEIIGHDAGATCAIVGPPRTGRTQMGVNLMIMWAHYLRPCFYQTHMGLLTSLDDAKSRRGRRSDAMATFVLPDLLVLDDLGNYPTSLTEDRIILEILNRRYLDGLTTLLISNQTEDQFREAMGRQMMARIEATGCLIDADWVLEDPLK